MPGTGARQDFVLPVGTVTLLLRSDIESSTDLWRDDSEAMAKALATRDVSGAADTTPVRCSGLVGGAS